MTLLVWVALGILWYLIGFVASIRYFVTRQALLFNKPSDEVCLWGEIWVIAIFIGIFGPIIAAVLAIHILFLWLNLREVTYGDLKRGIKRALFAPFVWPVRKFREWRVRRAFEKINKSAPKKIDNLSL